MECETFVFQQGEEVNGKVRHLYFRKVKTEICGK